MMAKLLPRRDRLAAASRWVRDKTEAFERAWERLDSETRRDADDCLARLRDAKDLRVGELDRAALSLRSDVDAIDRLSLEVSNAEASSGATGGNDPDGGTAAAPMSMVGFIHRFSELCHEVEALGARATPHLPDCDPDASLPRDLGDRLEAVAANRGWADALDVKDEMLWELADKLKAAETKLDSEKALTDEYAKEVAHWVDLTRDLQAELDAVKGKDDARDRLTRDHRRLLAEKDLVEDELKDAKKTIDKLKSDLRRARTANDANAHNGAPSPRPLRD